MTSNIRRSSCLINLVCSPTDGLLAIICQRAFIAMTLSLIHISGQTAGNTAQAASKTGKAARTVKEKAQQAGAFVMRHKKGFLMAGVLFLKMCIRDRY